EGKPGYDDVAIVRIEQLYPFPSAQVEEVVARRRPERIVWAQEEPRNMGAWDFLVPRFLGLGFEALYVGRKNSASPATGSKRRHEVEQRSIVDGAFTGAR